MNRQQFSEFVRNPASVNAQSLKVLEDLVKRFPYCQTGQILFTFNLFREGDLEYHTQLKKAAAYAGDRRILKELIEKGIITFENKTAENIIVPHPETEVVTVETLPQVQATLSKVSETQVVQEEPPTVVMPAQVPPVTSDSSKFQERLSHEELLTIVRKRLAEIGAEKSSKSSEALIPETGACSIQPDETTIIPVKDPARNALIEKFIREEPKISHPKAAFFSPAEISHQSNIDDEEIISETLAQLYASQGNIQKAIHIYEKLCLLNQEKSRLFAARIQELGANK